MCHHRSQSGPAVPASLRLDRAQCSTATSKEIQSDNKIDENRNLQDSGSFDYGEGRHLTNLLIDNNSNGAQSPVLNVNLDEDMLEILGEDPHKDKNTFKLHTAIESRRDIC